MNIARQNLQTAEKLYEVAQAKRRMGTISENDVLQLRLDVLTARSALTNAVSNRQARQFALRSFLDVETDIEPSVPEDVPQVRLDYDNVLSHALQNNALATTMRRRQMEADYAVASARANRQSINLYAQLGYTGTGDNMNSAYRNLLSNEVVSVGITVPLLDWGKRKGQRRLAESNRDIIQGQLRQQSQDFRQEGPAAPAVAGLPPGHLYPDRAVQQPGRATAHRLRGRHHRPPPLPHQRRDVQDRQHLDPRTLQRPDRQGPGPPEPHPATLQLLVLLLSAPQHRPLGLRAWLRTHGRRRTSH